MDDIVFYITVFIIGLITLIFRGAFVVPDKAHHLSNKLEFFLEYIPISSMAALTAAHIVYTQSGGAYEIAPDKIAAGTLAFIVAYFSKNILATFIVGMGALWVIQSLGLF
jgi:branched-subunit amino acid transport protein